MLGRLLLAMDDDEEAGLTGFLRASHLSSESARLLVLLAEEDVALSFLLPGAAALARPWADAGHLTTMTTPGCRCRLV